MVKLLVHRRFRHQAERNWKEGEEEHCDVALLDVVHGLLAPTYEMFVERTRQMLQGRREAERADGHEGGDAAEQGAGGAGHGAGVIVALGNANVDESEPGALSYQQRQARHRRIALAWLRTRQPEPLEQEVLLRIVMAPLQQLLNS